MLEVHQYTYADWREGLDKALTERRFVKEQ